MKPIFIFHFSPLEHYPPIQNLLHFLDGSSATRKVYCFTTKGRLNSTKFGKKITVYRLGHSSNNKLLLWATYLLFNLISLVFLILTRPNKLIYFESLSVFPVFLYKKYLNRKAKVFIHYHEYTTINEYQKSSLVRRYFHTKAKYLYSKASWISQTNEIRLQKFLADEGINYNGLVHHEMPNYPSKNWARPNMKWEKGQTLKFVYVGYSLTKEGSYLREIVDFFKNSKLPIELNVYCMVNNDYLRSFEESDANFIFKINEAVLYEELPQILSQQHVGLILYKAKTPNYIYNAPNKLFEYFSCGLDVWYPQEMEGIHSYDSLERPKVQRLDYNQLGQYNFTHLIERTEQENNISYFAEDVYGEFLMALMTH